VVGKPHVAACVTCTLAHAESGERAVCMTLILGQSLHDHQGRILQGGLGCGGVDTSSPHGEVELDKSLPDGEVERVKSSPNREYVL